MRHRVSLVDLVNQFASNLNSYKEPHSTYNESSCRLEYIDKLLIALGWDVSNSQGLLTQYREVIVEENLSETGRPDYSLAINGLSRIFVEAKKPLVDISIKLEPALQSRKYGWNAGHRISVLTNFEYLIIYDTTVVPKDSDGNAVARYKTYHFTEYVTKFDEIKALIGKEAVYSGDADRYIDKNLPASPSNRQPVDEYFLNEINEWRVNLSNELYIKGSPYDDIEVLNDAVQEFINQIIFIRICEDRNLPLYTKLSTINNPTTVKKELEALLKKADASYNSGLFSGPYIVLDLDSDTINQMIERLYYPQSPYLFNIIEPNLLGRIYELFLTEQLLLQDSGRIGLTRKRDYRDRSVITTPLGIVRRIVSHALVDVFKNKKPSEILPVRIADIACGSGVFLEEAFDYILNACVDWYQQNDPQHLIPVGSSRYKLPFGEKKSILLTLRGDVWGDLS